MERSKWGMLILAIVAFAVLSCKAPTGIERVWAIDDGEKIRKDDIASSLAHDEGNAVWKNDSIHVFGARNEVVAFQLIIQADSNGAAQVNVEISDLANDSSVIPGSEKGPDDPYDYRGRHIELFTEHYLNMEKRSPPLWFFSDSASPSDYYEGWVPDCLIPFSAAPGKGGAPFSIEPNTNQGVWVDILIPRETGAGRYTGNATVTVAGRTFTEIPIALTVYDFMLPDTNHIRTMFGYYRGAIAERHGLAEGSREYYELDMKYQQMAHRHRFDLVTGVDSLGMMDRLYKRYLTGEAYSAAHGYAGPGELVGNTTFSIGYGGDVPVEYGSNVNDMTQASWWAGSDAWENWFLQNAPGVERHKYLFPDEPDWKGPEGAKGTGSMDTIRMQARWSHSNPGTGKNIPTFVTNTIKPGLAGHVDFWSISSQEYVQKLTPEAVAKERADGNRFGIYNGFRPGMGAVVSDADAIEFRVMPWVVWKYGLDQYFYWSTTFWTSLNVFVNPLTYEDRINGDGTFLYPGQDKLFPEEDRNLAGPLSSIRAKNWRRGTQDFEYLWLARQAGLETELITIVNECIPTGLWEAKGQNDVSWPSRGYAFDQYRRALAELLSSTGKSP